MPAIAVELFRNKTCKRYFIFIGNDKAGKLLMIIPEGKVRPLAAHLFEGPYKKADYSPGIYQYG
jgi:hypothetical protein